MFIGSLRVSLCSLCPLCPLWSINTLLAGVHHSANIEASSVTEAIPRCAASKYLSTLSPSLLMPTRVSTPCWGWCFRNASSLRSLSSPTPASAPRHRRRNCVSSGRRAHHKRCGSIIHFCAHTVGPPKETSPPARPSETPSSSPLEITVYPGADSPRHPRPNVSTTCGPAAAGCAPTQSPPFSWKILLRQCSVGNSSTSQRVTPKATRTPRPSPRAAACPGLLRCSPAAKIARLPSVKHKTLVSTPAYAPEEARRRSRRSHRQDGPLHRGVDGAKGLSSSPNPSHADRSAPREQSFCDAEWQCPRFFSASRAPASRIPYATQAVPRKLRIHSHIRRSRYTFATTEAAANRNAQRNRP